jgi:hypothetical protein
MSFDVETRVRRANLVSRHRQLDRLYGNDLSHRLLRDVYSKKEGRMSEMTDRPDQGAVTDAPTDEKAFRPTPAPRRRRSPAYVPAILTAVIAIGVIVALAARQPAPVAAETPVEIAEAFLAALNDHDADAMLSLLGDHYVFGEGSNEKLLRGEIAQESVLGWTYHFEGCVDEGAVGDNARVSCDYAFSNDITRATGTGPYGGSTYVFSIDRDGEIRLADNTEADQQFHAEALQQFFDWLLEEHPDAGDMYYQYDAQNGPENLAKWERYLPEFVAAMEEAG